MDWKKILPLAGIAILIYILWKFDIEKILSVFSTLNPLYIILCFLSMPAFLLFLTIEWQLILKRQCIQVSYTYALKNMFIGYFYGFITPGGFGNYLRALYLRDESNAPLPKCISNIITFNTIDTITLFVLSSIGGLFLIGQYPYLVFLSLLCLFTVIVVFAFFLRQKKSKELFSRLLKTQIFQTIQQYITDPIDTFYEDLPTFKDLRLPFLVSIVGWIVFFTELYLIAGLFNIHLPFLTLFFILAIAASIAAIPISLYGLGTRDAALVALLSLYNIPPENCISFTLLWFTIFWVTPSIIGVVITLLEHQRSPVRKTL
ncbi:MAG: flippase-like domain-containing protein [Candidatus Thermoplasmatota archaeon]|nr:flippase-like domain-containing protein [Candidatus Thermoplasmatota archaeon]